VFLVNSFSALFAIPARLCSCIGLHDVGITLLARRAGPAFKVICAFFTHTREMVPGLAIIDLFCKHRIPRYHLVEALLIVREIDFGCELLCLLGENLFAFASCAPTHSLSWQKANRGIRI